MLSLGFMHKVRSTAKWAVPVSHSLPFDPRLLLLFDSQVKRWALAGRQGSERGLHGHGGASGKLQGGFPQISKHRSKNKTLRCRLEAGVYCSTPLEELCLHSFVMMGPGDVLQQSVPSGVPRLRSK